MTEVVVGDARAIPLPDESVHCVVTSPPYFSLRDYGVSGQIGLESSLAEYIATMVDVLREIRRVLRDDGQVWLNVGDSYAGSWGNMGHRASLDGGNNTQRTKTHDSWVRTGYISHRATPATATTKEFRAKCKMLVPHRLAIALCDDGWIVRQDVVFSKANPMPESTDDRPTTAHEFLFLLAKSNRATFWTHETLPGTRVRPEPDHVWRHRDTGEERDTAPPGWPSEEARKAWSRRNRWAGHDYYYDAEAIREPTDGGSPFNVFRGKAYMFQAGGQNNSKVAVAQEDRKPENVYGRQAEFNARGRNKRSVWHIPSEPFAGGHFATFPKALVSPCILAGTAQRCCPTCGAGWVRQVDESYTWAQRPVIADDDKSRHKMSGNHRASRKHGRASKVSTTTGFAPACDCPDNDGSGKALVLDPFCGSGTTGVVAAQMGRAFVGLELNPTYAAMARDRIAVEGEGRTRETDAAGRVAEQLTMGL